MLGVAPGVTAAELERAFMKRNFALIKGKSGAADVPQPELEAERARLRAAFEKLGAHLRAVEAAGAAASRDGTAGTGVGRGLRTPPMNESVAASSAGFGDPALQKPPRTLLTPPVLTARDPADDEFFLLRFDDWKVNTFVPPLLLAVTWLITISPLGFFLKGFHVWMHEFGHAVPAWLCGFRATPLPFGWTPVEPEYSHFVYWGLLLLFGLLFGAGLLERKVWAMIAAVGLAGLQYYMTWRMPEHRQEFWWSAFGGVGGEFVLSTLCMLFFWVQLPEKFRWGGCRYVFFFIGATTLIAIWVRWGDVYRGIEEIPFGSMINGEDDEGGDMNKLMDGYGWKKAEIRRNYYVLGKWCWVALGLMWLVFALRLNRVADWVVGKVGSKEEG
ncbi:hypothetical protein [Lacunisphaera limnophila]|uniref:hypothetical protein n=1 Tax=Lacunisphaera limnophila TaxID=1838286 RepID=UPI0012FD5577|nr:hypothetical protein [Lacunisphaera limnophila]